MVTKTLGLKLSSSYTLSHRIPFIKTFFSFNYFSLITLSYSVIQVEQHVAIKIRLKLWLKLFVAIRN